MDPSRSDSDKADAIFCAKTIIDLSSTRPIPPGKERQFLPVVEPAVKHSTRFSYEKSPTNWIIAYIIRPALLYHLAKLPKVSDADAKAGKAFANEVLEVVLASAPQFEVGFTMFNMPVDGDEVLTERVSIKPWEKGDKTAHMDLRLDPPQADKRDTAIDESRRLITALQLHGFDTSFDSVNLKTYPDWCVDTDSWEFLEDNLLNQAMEFAETKAIGLADLQQVIVTMRLLEKYNLERPKTIADSALYHFTLGLARHNEADALLDFVVALEALLLCGLEGELKYRFCVNGAFYLSDESMSKATIFKELDGLYKLRGQLVHGSKYPSQNQLEEKCSIAYMLTRRGLLRAISEEFPSKEGLDTMVLREV